MILCEKRKLKWLRRLNGRCWQLLFFVLFVVFSFAFTSSALATDQIMSENTDYYDNGGTQNQYLRGTSFLATQNNISGVSFSLTVFGYFAEQPTSTWSGTLHICNYEDIGGYLTGCDSTNEIYRYDFVDQETIASVYGGVMTDNMTTLFFDPVSLTIGNRYAFYLSYFDIEKFGVANPAYFNYSITNFDIGTSTLENLIIYNDQALITRLYYDDSVLNTIPTEILPGDFKSYLGIPYIFNLGDVNCCENEDCNIPFQALTAQSDLAPISLYINDDDCYFGKSGSISNILRYQWYMSPYSIENQLIIPSSTINSLGLGENSHCFAGQAMGYDPLTGTTTLKDFSSSGHAFYIHASTSPMCVLPSTPNFCVDPCYGMASTTIGDELFCGTKKIGCWLIIPDDSIKEQLSKNMTDLKGSFPFNLYFGLMENIKTAIATTTDDRSGNFSLPMYNGSGYYMIPVMTSTSLPNAVGSTNATTFRNTFIWLFWILGAVYIILRLKK